MTVRGIVKNVPTMTEEEVLQRYKDNDPNDEWYKTADADVANYNDLLAKYKTVDALSKYGTAKVVAWGKSTLQLKKDIACTIVSLRRRFESSVGKFPDWDGRTQAYKQAKRRMLQDSGLPQQDLAAIESAIKYHVQNLVVKVAPKKELEAVGMLTTSRRDRQNKKQQEQKDDTTTTETEGLSQEAPTPITIGTVTIDVQEPKANEAEHMIKTALDLLQGALKVKDLTKADKQVILSLSQSIHDTLASIQDKLSEAYEKAEKRKEQAAARRAAAANAADAA